MKLCSCHRRPKNGKRKTPSRSQERRLRSGAQCKTPRDRLALPQQKVPIQAALTSLVGIVLGPLLALSHLQTACKVSHLPPEGSTPWNSTPEPVLHPLQEQKRRPACASTSRHVLGLRLSLQLAFPAVGHLASRRIISALRFVLVSVLKQACHDLRIGGG